MNISAATIAAARGRAERYLAGLKFTLSPSDRAAAMKLCMLKQLAPEGDHVWELALQSLLLEYVEVRNG